MDNFRRAVLLAMRWRWTLGGAAFSALMVAVLWGGNISAIFPFVELVFRGQSLQQWAEGELRRAEREVTACERQISDGERRLQLSDSALLDELHTTAAELSAALAAQPLVPDAATGHSRPDPRQAHAERLQWLVEQPPTVVRRHVQAEIDAAQARLPNERRAVAWYQWIKPRAERYLPQDPFQTLLWVLGLLILGTLVKCAFMVANSIFSARLAYLATFDLRNELFRHALRMDVKTFSEEGVGELMSRFTYDLENLTEGLNSLFGKAIREPLKMLACLIGASLVCWRLLLLSLLIAPLGAFLVNRLSRLLKKANRRAMEEMSQMYGVLEETLQGIKVVKAFTMEPAERNRFYQRGKKYLRKSLRIVRYEALARPMMELMGMLTIVLALLAGAYLVLTGETHILGIRLCARPLSLSSLLMFYGLLAGTSDPARKLSEIFNRLQRAAAASDRIYATLAHTAEIRERPGRKPLPRHQREIVFRNVRFEYVPGVPVLNQIDLRVPFGETIAFVGANGCGKSTLVNLLPRFYDATAGEVLIDGVDVRDCRLRDLRSQIGLVTQETLLFDETVYNNIRYGSPSATREQILEAAERSKAHRFIEDRLADGYETIAGSRGGMLSGGQRQRIALARAILRDPSILILDEATSQIDLESEQLIHRVLEEFRRGRTTFIITHRLSTLALADRIVVMHEGRIVDVGPHEELAKRCPQYNRLHQLSAAG